MRPDVPTPLLAEVMDSGYEAAKGDHRRRSAPDSVAVAVLALVLGVAGAIAVVQMRGSHSDEQGVREVLIAQITRRQAAVDAAQSASADLTTQIDALNSELRPDRYGDLLASIHTDGVSTGREPVTGPGLVVTLVESDSPVLDSDVQRIVNALWAGGAEAIAINGHRLTPLSAIRTAGGAVLVDLEPLISPYQVSAIGDANAMQVQMARSGTTDHLRVLEGNYGIRSSLTPQSSLALPGSGDAKLYYAHATKEP